MWCPSSPWAICDQRIKNVERAGARAGKEVASSKWKRLTECGMRMWTGKSWLELDRVSVMEHKTCGRPASNSKPLEAGSNRGADCKQCHLCHQQPDQNRYGQWPRLSLIYNQRAADVWRRLETNGSASGAVAGDVVHVISGSDRLVHYSVHAAPSNRRFLEENRPLGLK